jgi:hypothetical protein
VPSAPSRGRATMRGAGSRERAAFAEAVCLSACAPHCPPCSYHKAPLLLLHKPHHCPKSSKPQNPEPQTLTSADLVRVRAAAAFSTRYLLHPPPPGTKSTCENAHTPSRTHACRGSGAGRAAARRYTLSVLYTHPGSGAGRAAAAASARLRAAGAPDQRAPPGACGAWRPASRGDPQARRCRWRTCTPRGQDPSLYQEIFAAGVADVQGQLPPWWPHHIKWRRLSRRRRHYESTDGRAGWHAGRQQTDGLAPRGEQVTRRSGKSLLDRMQAGRQMATHRPGSAFLAGADMSIDGRTLSSSTQYGTACSAHGHTKLRWQSNGPTDGAPFTPSDRWTD